MERKATMNSKKTGQFYYRYHPRDKRDREALLSHFTMQEVLNGFLVAMDVPSPLHPGGKSFALFDNVSQFLSMMRKLPKKDRNFYEVILEPMPQKLKFDIECTEDWETADEQFEQFIGAICFAFKECYGKQLPKENLVVCQSHGEHKKSWHVLVDGFYVDSTTEAKEFYHCVWHYAPHTVTASGNPCLDPLVYSSFQAFRLLGCQKKGSGRPKVLASNHKGAHTLVTNVKGCEKLPSLLPLLDPPVDAFTDEARYMRRRKVKKHDIPALLAQLSDFRWQMYTSWLYLGAALKHHMGKAGLELWKQYSAACNMNYDEKTLNRRWKALPRSRRDDKVSLDQIVAWAEDEEELGYTWFDWLSEEE